MRGPFYLLETLSREPTHMVDRIAVETDPSKLIGVAAASTLTLTMFSALAALIGPDMYESSKGLMQFAVEQNSIPLSAAVGMIVVANSCLAAVGMSGIAEANSLARESEQRLRELYIASQ